MHARHPIAGRVGKWALATCSRLKLEWGLNHEEAFSGDGVGAGFVESGVRGGSGDQGTTLSGRSRCELDRELSRHSGRIGSAKWNIPRPEWPSASAAQRE